MKNPLRKLFAFGVCAMVMAIPTSSSALTLTPTMIVLEGRDRYADLNVINNGDTRMNYTVFWRFFRQNDVLGNYFDADKSLTDFDITKNIVFTPKRMAVESQEMQKVRLGLRLKGEPPTPGDYRAHLEVREKPDASTNAIPGKAAGQSAGRNVVGVGLNVGFSIPVIYRVGEPDVGAEIGTVTTKINKNGQIELTVPVSRIPAESKFSLLGEFQIFYNDQKIGEQKNSNVFPEAKSRDFKITLNAKSLNSGSLRIVYSDYKKGDKQKIYAEKTMPIGR